MMQNRFQVLRFGFLNKYIVIGTIPQRLVPFKCDQIKKKKLFDLLDLRKRSFDGIEK